MNKVNLSFLDTEKINEATSEIHSKNSLEILKLINNEDMKVANIVGSKLDDVARIVDIGVTTLENKGRIIYLGAGNSGRIAAGDACECIPTFGVDSNTIVAVIAGGDNAIIRADEGAEDNSTQACEDLKGKKLNKNDFVIGLSASGRTPYVLGGLEFARKIGCKTAAIACSKNSEISIGVDVAVEIVVGAEVIMGSTRMKAGTAQKMVVNMISSGVMIKIGKVYKNYMIDVSVKNKKLFERGKKIIKEVTDSTDKVAEEYLLKSKGSVKLAILMILKEESLENCLRLVESEPNICKLI